MKLTAENQAGESQAATGKKVESYRPLTAVEERVAALPRVETVITTSAYPTAALTKQNDQENQ